MKGRDLHCVEGKIVYEIARYTIRVEGQCIEGHCMEDRETPNRQGVQHNYHIEVTQHSYRTSYKRHEQGLWHSYCMLYRRHILWSWNYHHMSYE